ncbi:cleavage stimulation factor subunit 3 [Galendromus occidentalis]|uniref:Cleavage stimulation factor subunit 3 n=1 Tax=Galendromus occidentalis TaxID=34638 RepID=A0AAJ6VX13_9ACAR|nr:cleavage stimulation factor subunit 3 [Galendromus occidentalis]
MSDTERFRASEKRLEDNPYDIEAWSVLVRDAQARKIEDAREIYEKLVTTFPNTGRYWKVYIEHELKARCFDRVEKLFTRCLIKVLNMDLWKCYLAYVKETKASLPSYREKMAQAYDFTLDKMGMDVTSYSVWNDYVNFLKSVDAVGSYAENQRITAVRKVYQKGVHNPMTNIEQLWKDYVTYEQNINPLIAEKMIADRSRDYMNARRVSKEYGDNSRGINKNMPSVPPQGNPEEMRQLEQWKKLIAWEKSNPLRSEDTSLVTRRVMFAYEQCLLCLGHHADIWLQAAQFLDERSRDAADRGDPTLAKQYAEDAAQMYERAVSGLLSKCQLLYFAYADFEEGRNNHEKVHTIYNRLIEIQDVDPTLAYVQYLKFARRAEGIKSARQVFKKAREDDRSNHHVYVAAALMEYNCSKDTTIAVKIFELGLKKYGGNSDYVLAYIDYLSHQNDDSNTRVLFERVLNSGQLSAEKSLDIWNKFLEFESQIGDLTSILKVEKRRAAAIEKLKEFEGKETALLVDRYRFLEMVPCSPAELVTMGYRELLMKNKTSLIGGLANNVMMEANAESKSKLFEPNVLHMIPFKPKQSYPNGAHPVPGGVFPAPPAASELMVRLPPPSSFNGPFVAVDKLMDIFMTMTLPNKLPEPDGAQSGLSLKIFEHVLKPVDFGHGQKRLRTGDNSDSENEENGYPIQPANDIYRARQQRKVQQQQLR